MKTLTSFILTLLLTNSFVLSQDTIKTIQTEVRLHLNTRNAKIDTCFDYYVGIGSKITIKKFVIIDLKGSYERSNGINYLAHSEKASCKYGQVGYKYDTEKDIKLFYTSAYYTFWKMLKVGYDFSVQQVPNHSVYLGFKWKFISGEIVFLEDLRRFKYLINPTLKKWDRLSLKANIEGFYVPGKFKWNNGITFNLKIN